MKRPILAVSVLFFLNVNLFAGNTITVSSANDAGVGSLRVAINNLASAGDTIRFALSTYPDTIWLTTGEITIGVSLTIIGLGDDSTFISGNNSSRIFKINAGDSVSVEHLSLFQGMAADSGGAVFNNGSLVMRHCNLNHNTALHGGAIVNKSALTLFNSVFDHNSATGFGGAVFSTAGNLNAVGCQFMNNTSVTGGGAIACNSPGSYNNITVSHNTSNTGGGLYCQNTFTISTSTVSSNNANSGNGGGMYNAGNAKVTGSVFSNNRVNNSNFSGAAIFSSNILQVVTCTVDSNFSAGNGGGISSSSTASVVNSTLNANNANSGNGGAIYSSGSMYVSNSTLSGNHADVNGGGISSSSDFLIERTTITENQAGSNGGGIYSSDSLQFSNTIVGGNNSNGQGPEIFEASGNVISLGYNLVTDIAEAGFNPGTHDILGTAAIPVDPLLAPLADNGGTTLTHLPFCSSPVINTGDSTNSPSTDQAGNPRVHGDAMDIGSVEVQADPVTIDKIIINETAAGAGDGMIEAIVSGGTEPYTYEWSTGSDQNRITNLHAGNYRLTVTDFNDCIDSAIFTISVGDAIAGIETNFVSVYPNPVHDFFSLEYNHPSKGATLEVLDINGKVMHLFILSSDDKSFQFNVKDLPAGSYLLKLTDGKKISVGNLLKE